MWSSCRGVHDLKNFVAGFAAKWIDDSGKEKEPLHTEKIPIDETRSKESLFTRRGRRYLNSIELIRNFKPEDDDTSPISTANNKDKSKLPDKVKISQLKDYLNDPFQFYVNRILSLEKSDDDPTEKYVEPISLSTLDEALFLRQAVYIEKGLNKDYANTDLFFSSLANQGNIPAGKFGDGVGEKIKGRAQEIKNELDRLFPEGTYTCQSIELNESIKGQTDKQEQLEFILQGNIPLVFTSTEKYVVVEINTKNSAPKPYKYLTPYISALALIASGKTKKVDLFVATGSRKDDSYESNSCHIEINPGDAKKRLSNIYEKAFIEKDKKILPIDLVCTELSYLEELKQKLDDNHGPWQLFDGREVFVQDLEKHSGYSKHNFMQEWKAVCDAQKKLLCDSLVQKINQQV